jgi:hypothetical protein
VEELVEDIRRQENVKRMARAVDERWRASIDKGKKAKELPFAEEKKPVEETSSEGPQPGNNPGEKFEPQPWATKVSPRS